MEQTEIFANHLENSNVFESFNKKRKICVQVLEHSRDAIEIQFTNLNYDYEKKRKFKIVVILTLILLFYILCFNRKILVVISIISILFLQVITILNLVKKDSISFYGGLALQISTIYFCNFKSSYFIPADFIFDVVINEVIENLSVKYILVARTKKDVFKKRPLIPLLTSLDPSIDCLEFIYGKLRKKILLSNNKIL